MRTFAYHQPETVAQASALLNDDNARPLAGGMTLLPTMKLRMAAPSALVDLRAVPGLSEIKLADKYLEIGAMTTHDTVSRSEIVRSTIPALARLAGGIGDPQVRNRGTLGGSIANNDPTADYPAAVLALNADSGDGSAGNRGRRFLQGLVRNSAAARRDSDLGALSGPGSRGLCEAAQSGFPLCSRRRVRGEIPGRGACRGDGCGAVCFPCPHVRGSAGRRFFAVGDRADHHRSHAAHERHSCRFRISRSSDHGDGATRRDLLRS